MSSLHKIDCDQVFGGVVNEYGGGCRTCNPGLTFVKHEGRKSSTIESLKQVYVPHSATCRCYHWERQGKEERPAAMQQMPGGRINLQRHCHPNEPRLLGKEWNALNAPPTTSTFWCKICVHSVCQGLMVDQSDISRPYHCPNPLACPGGLLSADESTPMCTKGRVKKKNMRKPVLLNKTDPLSF